MTCVKISITICFFVTPTMLHELVERIDVYHIQGEYSGAFSITSPAIGNLYSG